MNKVITINLGGTAWQLEEGGYDTLRAYLETATTRLQGNPDRDEIISDIEWAIAEKFRGRLSNHKNVILNQEVSAVLAEMGPIEAEPGKAATPGPIGPGSAGSPSGANAPGAAGAAQEERGPAAGGAPKRLYRIQEGAMLAGVCNGLAAYFHIDPTLVRLGFAFLTILWGFGAIVYLIMAIVIPVAQTAEEKSAASGNPFTAQDFIHRAQAGYYEAMKGFPDRQARREWKRRFKREMRAHTHQWRCNWQSYWARHSPIQPRMSLLLPLISLLHGAATMACLCTLVSLLATGAVFGHPLPANVPVWLAAVLLLFLFGFVVTPLKLARRACYWGYGESHPGWSWHFLVDAFVWFAVVFVLICLGWHFFPELSDAVKSLPANIHQATNDIQTWWKNK